MTNFRGSISENCDFVFRDFWMNVYQEGEEQILGSDWEFRRQAEFYQDECTVYRIHVKLKDNQP